MLTLHPADRCYSAKTLNPHTLTCTQMWSAESSDGCYTPALPDKPTDNREKSGQTSVTLTSSIPSFLLLFSHSLTLPLLGHALLSYHWKIDPWGNGWLTSASTHAHTHTRSDDWQAWHQSVTPQWLPVKTFDWQSPSPASSMCSLIMKQWNSASGQKPVFSPA